MCPPKRVRQDRTVLQTTSGPCCVKQGMHALVGQPFPRHVLLEISVLVRGLRRVRHVPSEHRLRRLRLRRVWCVNQGRRALEELPKQPAHLDPIVQMAPTWNVAQRGDLGMQPGFQVRCAPDSVALGGMVRCPGRAVVPAMDPARRDTGVRRARHVPRTASVRPDFTALKGQWHPCRVLAG